MSEPQTKLEPQVNNKRSFSRRDFLKLGGAALLRLTTPAILSGDTPLVVSPERKLNSEILLLDIFNGGKPARENLLENIPESDEEIKSLAIDYYRQKFGDHGDKVYGVMQKTAESLGEDTRFESITKVSIANAVQFKEIEKDELGNPTIWVEIDERYLGDQISMSPESVINMSFELGRVPIKMRLYTKEMSAEEIDKFNEMGFTEIKINGRITYKTSDGKTYTEEEYYKLIDQFSTGKIVELDERDRRIIHEDGYSGEDTYENLKKLSVLANKHPDKIFCAAGGNPSKETGKRPDIRKARKKLEEEGLWAKNLLMFGYTDEHPYSHQIEPMELGVDYYIDADQTLNPMGAESASSFATAYVSKFISNIIDGSDNKLSLIKAKLDEFSTEKEVDITDTEVEIIKYKLLDYKN